MAPSSMNSQPWRFVVFDSRIHIFSKKHASDRLGKWDELNFGIMFSHMMVVAEELWLDVDLIRLDETESEEFSKQSVCAQRHPSSVKQFIIQKKKLLTNEKAYSILVFVSEEQRRDARVAQWWSIALPRRGSRVRIPSRAYKKRSYREIPF